MTLELYFGLGIAGLVTLTHIAIWFSERHDK